MTLRSYEGIFFCTRLTVGMDINQELLGEPLNNYAQWLVEKLPLRTLLENVLYGIMTSFISAACIKVSAVSSLL
jgi:hypothetical protein